MHNEPLSLEGELRQAMYRVEAPAGFADGVLCRIESKPFPTKRIGQTAQPEVTGTLATVSRFGLVRHLPALRFSPALAAALLLMLLPLSSYLYQQHRQAQAEAAAQQFTLAMRLTHAALLDAGQQVVEHEVVEHGRTRNSE